jgi:hypothetical protein
MSYNLQFDPNDFLDFQSSEISIPPDHLSQRILRNVQIDLNPSVWRVFARLALIHFCVGLMTLSICPQFGFKLLGNDVGLMGVFMHFGPYGCGIGCGSFFLGTSILIASFLLRIEELRQFKKNSFLVVGALVLLSMGFFIMLDAPKILFGFAIAWLLGSFLMGISLVEIVCAVRLKLSNEGGKAFVAE